MNGDNCEIIGETIRTNNHVIATNACSRFLEQIDGGDGDRTPSDVIDRSMVAKPPSPLNPNRDSVFMN